MLRSLASTGGLVGFGVDHFKNFLARQWWGMPLVLVLGR